MLKRIANTKEDGHALQKRASGVLQILRKMGTLYKSAPVEDGHALQKRASGN
jgi:hypothetical protein